MAKLVLKGTFREVINTLWVLRAVVGDAKISDFARKSA